jgi:hypothetical protein
MRLSERSKVLEKRDGMRQLVRFFYGGNSTKERQSISIAIPSTSNTGGYSGGGNDGGGSGGSISQQVDYAVG